MLAPIELDTFLGRRRGRPIAGGHQSVVLEAVAPSGARSVAKLRPADMTDPVELAARMGAVVHLTAMDTRLCGPIPFRGDVVSQVVVDGDLMHGTLFEYADGAAVSSGDAGDATLMGRTVAQLHANFRQVSAQPVSPAAALPTTGFRPTGPVQLIHGDFSDQNLRRVGTELRVFDLDDVAYAPVEFEIANSLYMVLFDATVREDPNRYERFSAAFRTGYAQTSDRAIDDDLVASFIDLRVEALDRWLSDLDAAPAGIRLATPEWHATLADFVDRHRADRL